MTTTICVMVSDELLIRDVSLILLFLVIATYIVLDARNLNRPRIKRLLVLYVIANAVYNTNSQSDNSRAVIRRF